MALIKCPECGQEISDTVKTCPNCGVKIKKLRRKKSKKKKIIVGLTCGILLIISIAVGVTTLYLTSPVYKFQKELLNQNYEDAKKILEQDISENDDNYIKAKEKAVGIMKDALDEYARGKKGYDECKNIENFIVENFQDINCEDYAKSLGLIKTSKENFNNAESKKKEKKHLDAIFYYEKISEEDIEHYEDVKKEIQICKDEYKKQIILEIQKQVTLDTPEKGYSSVANKILQTDWITEDKEVSNELSKLNEAVKNSVISNADKLSNEKKYSDAIKYINDNLPTVYLESDEIERKITSLKKLLVKDVTKKSEKYITQGKLNSAENILNKNMDYDIDNTLQKKLNSVNKKIENKALLEFRNLKQQVTIGYDSVDKNYIVVGKGYSTEYVNVSQSVNIEARMHVDKNEEIATFFLTFGFSQDDWIFTEQIKIVSGNYSTKFNVEYFDRQTQVFMGGIAEWIMLVDTSSFDQFYDIDAPSLDSDLIDAIDVITSSKEVTIRFSGEGRRDHTVTDSEKKNIKNIRKMYELLQKYPEFFEEF